MKYVVKSQFECGKGKSFEPGQVLSKSDLQKIGDSLQDGLDHGCILAIEESEAPKEEKLEAEKKAKDEGVAERGELHGR